MAKPFIHAQNSAKQYGGVPEDYMGIHNFLDSSKGTIPDSRHRALTHNAWFIAPEGPLERAFGVNITNSDGRLVSVRDIGEQHILEDFGMRFIPSAQDYLQEINIKEWMIQGKGVPPSFALIVEKAKNAIKKVVNWKLDVPQEFVPTKRNRAGKPSTLID
jgi:hypothetical protein